MRFFRPRQTLEHLPALAVPAAAMQVLQSAAEFREQLLRLIGQARHRIFLCSLYLQNDEAGQQIMAALQAAKQARPALDIQVFVDWHRARRGLIGQAATGSNADWYQQLSAAGDAAVPVYGVPVQTRELFGVLHLKGHVIDDTVLYTGAGINNVYLQMHGKYRHDRYLLVQHAALANSMVNFMRSHLLGSAAVQRLDLPEPPATRQLRGLIRAFRASLKKAQYSFTATDAPAPGQVSLTPLCGVGKNNPLNKTIVQMFAHARRSMTICTPYFNLPLTLKREINKALKRGVEIDIIVGDKVANDFYIPPEQPFKVIGALPYLYEMNLRRFARSHQREIQNGQLRLHLWRDGDNTFHLKGLWADQEYVLVTGNNLNPRAFRLDLENALLIRDSSQQLSALWQQELQEIHRHTSVIAHYRQLQTLSDYPLPVRQLLGRLSAVRLDRLAYRVL